MIKYIKGDILDVTEGIIVQQVNCFGVMGAGLAKQIRDKWPKVYDNYQIRINSVEDNKNVLGMSSWTYVNNQLIVASIFGQYNYGYGKRFTLYPALFKGLKYVFDTAKANQIPVYIPKGLGCGLAGGNWDFVESYIKDLDYMFDNEIDVTIVEKETK